MRGRAKLIVLVVSVVALSWFVASLVWIVWQTGRIELLAALHLLILGVALWVITRPTPQASGLRCFRCSGRVYPTRRAHDRERLWTCFMCGLELPRNVSMRRAPIETRATPPA